MELAFVVYLISILESVSSWFSLITIISGGALFVTILWGVLEHGNAAYYKKTFIALVSIIIVFGSLRSLLPSEKQAYAIAAAYGAQQVYQSEEAKQIGNKVLKAINNKLDELGEKEKK